MIKIKRKIIKEEDTQQKPFFNIPNIQNTMDAVSKETSREPTWTFVGSEPRCCPSCSQGWLPRIRA